MPNLREHLKASKRLLGSAHPLVHQILDAQNATLEHRFRHTPETVEAICQLLGAEYGMEAWLHIFMDWGFIDKGDWKV